MKAFLTALLLCLSVTNTIAGSIDNQSHDTDKLYKSLIKSVESSDFDLMASTYHPDAVLVSSKKTSAISNAIKRWTIEGNKLKNEGGKATLAFRFKNRLINDTTSFETGIYRYATIDKSGKEKVYLAHFEDLNVKKSGKWLTIMENQTAKASIDEWNELPQWN